MSFALNSVFTPITAAPKGIGIKEIAPCPQLSRYVRCFWIYEPTLYSGAIRIIPDCCCDIIIPLDGTDRSRFCGASNRSFISENCGSVFGIRFFAWTYNSFSDVNAEKLFNGGMLARDLFDGFDEFESAIKAAKGIVDRVLLAQNYLLRILNTEAENANVMNGLYYAINNLGRIKSKDLELYCAASMRTLERNFVKVLGASPKQTIEMLRYQMLWQDCISSSFDILDSVYKYGYYDQAHLYNDFRKFHGISIAQAQDEYKKLSQFYNTL